MRKVIESNGTLRPDVTLEVHEDACVFVDASGRELVTDDGSAPARINVTGVDAKMELLTMLHEKFSVQSAIEDRG